MLEVDGSTSEAAWKSLDDVVAGAVPVAGLVTEALVDHLPVPPAAGGGVRVCCAAATTSCSPGCRARAAHPGRWTLPGGGVDHGEHPSVALAREVEEECGLPCEVGPLVGVHDTHFSGNAPSGRIEDYHGVHLVFTATVGDGEPRVLEVDGTTDAVAWVPVADIESGEVEVLDLVRTRWPTGPRRGGTAVTESVFTYAAPGLKFGRGASNEIGWDVQQLSHGRGRPGGSCSSPTRGSPRPATPHGSPSGSARAGSR